MAVPLKRMISEFVSGLRFEDIPQAAVKAIRQISTRARRLKNFWALRHSFNQLEGKVGDRPP